MIRNSGTFKYIWTIFIAVSAFNLLFGADDEIDPTALFQTHTDIYLFRRSLDFESEIILQEAFLTWLYQGITKEADQRRKEDWVKTLEAFGPIDLATFEDSAYFLPAELDSAPSRVRYNKWEELQREKYAQKYIQARHVKDNLIKTANPEQRHRMFTFDLEMAILSYHYQRYYEAILRFNEVVERYGYQNLTDIYFYRGESYFAISIYNQAFNDYDYVINNSDDNDLIKKTYKRLIAIEGDRGDSRRVATLWTKYEEVTGAEKKDDYWLVCDMTARYQMAMQKWTIAQELFDRIPAKRDNFAEAKNLAADCALAQLDLEDAKNRFTLIAEKEIKGKGFTTERRQEAVLKLGYIHYLNGDYELAIDALKKIDLEGELRQKAIIIAAWSNFKLHDYGQVIELCDDFLEKYSDSQYFYEIFCLLGYSEEVLGREENAVREYEKVMVAVDDRREYHDINYEKNTVAVRIGELQRLEPTLFLEGREEMFQSYQKLRDELRAIFERLRLTEGIKGSPEIVEILEEQKELHRVFKELTEIEDSLFASDDSRLTREYDKMYSQIMNMASKLKSGLTWHMQQKTLIQREEEGNYQGRSADSLRTRFVNEWNSTEASLERVRDLINSAQSVNDKDMLKELGAVELGLMGIQNKLMHIRTNLEEIPNTSLNSNLDWWSWFAYQRHSTAGLALDYLYMREDRVKELNEYINRINDIIADRIGVEEEFVELAENLIPASEPGREPYYAPPVPLWQPPEPEIDTTAFEVIDTTTINVIDSTSTGETEFPASIEEDSPDSLFNQENLEIPIPTETQKSDIPEQDKDSIKESEPDETPDEAEDINATPSDSVKTLPDQSEEEESAIPDKKDEEAIETEPITTSDSETPIEEISTESDSLNAKETEDLEKIEGPDEAPPDSLQGDNDNPESSTNSSQELQQPITEEESAGESDNNESKDDESTGQ
jgi:outer membrane protein assembly factor BamD (BamD/ComL family)